MRRTFIVVVLAALVVGGVAGPVGAAEGSNSPMPSAEQDFFAAINGERADAGRPALKWHTQATSVARAHSNDMADDGELRHNGNLASQMSGWRALGENVGHGPSVNAIHTAFMGSSSHRSNILDAGFSHVGIGVVERDGSLWVTEVFVTPSSSSSSGTTSGGSGGSTSDPSPAPRVPSPTIKRSLQRSTVTVRPALVKAAVAGVHPVARSAAPVDPGVGAGTLSVLERLVDEDVVRDDRSRCSRGPC